MTVELRRSMSVLFVDEPLTWKPVRMPGQKWSATVVCGNGHDGLIDEHQIADDGAVSPSVVCTQDGCDWHEFVKLMDWREGIEALGGRL